MIALQEELDWRCYRLYGLHGRRADASTSGCGARRSTSASAPSRSSWRARWRAGELETTWFERHGSTPITEFPAHWPEDYRRLVERRIALIESDRNIGLIEQPEYKRRWNTEPWEAQEQRALRGWLLDRLETDALLADGRRSRPPAASPTGAAQDADFMQVAELYRGHPDFDVHALVAELVEGEAVPFLPVLRYKRIRPAQPRASGSAPGSCSGARTPSTPRSKQNS